MKGVSRNVILTISVLTMFIIISCTENKNHDLLILSNNAEQISYEFKVNSEYISPLYELEFKCLNTDHYSSDSFELVSYKMIEITDYEDLKIKREINGSKLNGFRLENKNSMIHMVNFPDDSESRKTSIKKMKTICESPYNELLRIEYKLESNKNQNQVKILAYSNSRITDEKTFDWKYFLTNKENLYNIYKEYVKCKHKWKMKF